MSIHTTNQEESAQSGRTTEMVPQGQYEAYLLRLWWNDGQATWRASLQAVRTGERHMFADLDSLLTFLNGHFNLEIRNSDENPRT